MSIQTIDITDDSIPTKLIRHTSQSSIGYTLKPHMQQRRQLMWQTEPPNDSINLKMMPTICVEVLCDAVFGNLSANLCLAKVFQTVCLRLVSNTGL